MSNKVKLGLYIVLTLGACIFGYLSFSTYQRLMDNESKVEAAPLDVPALHTKPSPESSRGFARVISYGAVFFVMVLGLGLLAGHEVSQFFGNRVVKTLYDDENDETNNPDYEAAESEWANGNHLEAIRLMREYLQKYPREQHAAIRIAEIYEKDLQNNLAAALEYEEVLKHKLAPERWGWAAIHLCNLYFKLNQEDKAVALLRRIDTEFGETSAAEKARKRLAQLDLTSGEPVDAAAGEQISIEDSEPEPAKPASNLPPGFTLKKR